MLILNVRTPVRTKLAEKPGRPTPRLPLQVNGAYSSPSPSGDRPTVASDGTDDYAAEKDAGGSVSCRTGHATVCT